LDKKLAKLNLGQFLFLQFVGQNVGHAVFKSILETLAMEDRNIRMPQLKGLAIPALEFQVGLSIHWIY
jgi:hypothetical protein